MGVSIFMKPVRIVIAVSVDLRVLIRHAADEISLEMVTRRRKILKRRGRGDRGEKRVLRLRAVGVSIFIKPIRIVIAVRVARLLPERSILS